MDNSILYERTMDYALDLLKDTISSFNKSYETRYKHYNSCPVFSITSNKIELLRMVSNLGDYQIRNIIADLCMSLYNENISEVIDTTSIKDVDFCVIKNGKKIGYYVSLHEEYMLDLENAKLIGIEQVINIVLRSGIMGLRPNTKEYKSYQDKGKITHITLKEYFDKISPNEYEEFEKYIAYYNNEAEILLGITLSPMPTKNALSKKWQKIKTEFSTYFYEECLSQYFENDEIEVLKREFLQKQFLDKAHGNYVDSFVSSEWYYDMLKKTDVQMEQTAIVAGYFKSIEQLLFSMMLSKCDKLQFKLFQKNTSLCESSATKKRTPVVLTKENHTSLLTMAGNLLKSIDINFGINLSAVYITHNIGIKVQRFLFDFVKNTRNGYLHKDNIYDEKIVEQIRKETYGAFFLLASAFNYDINKL